MNRKKLHRSYEEEGKTDLVSMKVTEVPKTSRYGTSPRGKEKNEMSYRIKTLLVLQQPMLAFTGQQTIIV